MIFFCFCHFFQSLKKMETRSKTRKNGNKDEPPKKKEDKFYIYISSSESSSTDDSNDEILSKKAPPSKEEYGICRICHKNELDVMFHPCNHSTCCFECWLKTKEPRRCPYCGALVTKYERFFLA